jgi:hypothetical protein
LLKTIAGYNNELRFKCSQLALLYERYSMNRKLCVFLCLAICLSAATRANAYIDPGIGTYTFQILIAGLMATFFSLSRLWKRIFGVFSEKTVGSGDHDRSVHMSSCELSHATSTDSDAKKANPA